MVEITGGYFNFAAPHVECDALTATCPVQLNQLRVEFSDFSVRGRTVSGLYLELDIQALTPSGQAVFGNSFLFSIPSGVVFDAIGFIDGKKSGIAVTSDQAVQGRS